MRKIGYFIVTFNDTFSVSVELDFMGLYGFYTALQGGLYDSHGSMEKIELCYYSLRQDTFLHTDALRLLSLALQSKDTPLWLLSELSMMSKEIVEDNYWSARGLPDSLRSRNDIDKLSRLLA